MKPHLSGCTDGCHTFLFSRFRPRRSSCFTSVRVRGLCFPSSGELHDSPRNMIKMKCGLWACVFFTKQLKVLWLTVLGNPDYFSVTVGINNFLCNLKWIKMECGLSFSTPMVLLSVEGDGNIIIITQFPHTVISVISTCRDISFLEKQDSECCCLQQSFYPQHDCANFILVHLNPYSGTLFFSPLSRTEAVMFLRIALSVT